MHVHGIHYLLTIHHVMESQCNVLYCIVHVIKVPVSFLILLSLFLYNGTILSGAWLLVP